MAPRRSARSPLVPTAAIALSALLISAAAPPAAFAADEIAIADTGATAQTRSLFAFLRDQQGQGALFGQQHATDYAIGGGLSDAYDVTGDYPAIFGFDTLVIDGREKPGVSGDSPEQNADRLGAAFVDADARGAIPTLSAHLSNFATGGNYDDVSGRVVSRILPGGVDNADFREYLDLIARAAGAAERPDGTLVPVIFRPFHENTGSWFWWGAAHATPGEYKEIFRYTVEYLRDVKGVHNLLYAFSPNGVLNGDAARYLETYPGDEWVDVLGYDSYENSNAADDSSAWITTTVDDLGMIAEIAESRGKIAAFTEFGRNGDRTITPSGNKSLSYFTDLAEALEGDPDASRIAFMLTWANFGGGQIYVPPIGHEMAGDFAAFEADPFTLFVSDLPGDVHDRVAEAAPATRGIRVVSPAAGVRVETASTTVRAKLTGNAGDVAGATFTVAGAGDGAAHPMTLDADGYWSAEWTIDESELDNREVTLTVSATVDGEELTSDSSIILGTAPELAPGVVDDFESYSSDAALRAAYTAENTAPTTFSLSEVDGRSRALRIDYALPVGGYLGFSKAYPTPQNWSADSELHLWLDPDASGQKLVLQINAGGLAFEAYPSLEGDDAGELVIPFADFRTPAWQNQPDARLTPERLASITKFGVFVNQVGPDAVSGTLLVDDLRTDGEGDYYDPENPPASSTPIVLEDFESYADTAALRAAWSNRNGATQLQLEHDRVGSGDQAAGYTFDFTSQSYAEVARWVGGQEIGNWAGRTQLSMWVDPNEVGQNLLVQFRTPAQPGQTEDTFWNLQVPLTGHEAQQVHLPFADAVVGWPSGISPTLRPTDADLASVREVVVMATKGEDSAPATGTFFLDDLTVDGGGSVEPEYPAGTPISLDGFEGYTDDADLRAGWSNRNGAEQLALDTEHVGHGKQSAGFTYDFSQQDYSQVARWVGGQNWVGLGGVNLWADAGGHAQIVIVQFRTGPVAGQSEDTFWNLQATLEPGTPQFAAALPALSGDIMPFADAAAAGSGELHLPFAEAVASWPAGIDPQLRPNDALLSSVTEVVVMITQADPEDVSGTVYLDDLAVGDVDFGGEGSPGIGEPGTNEPGTEQPGGQAGPQAPQGSSSGGTLASTGIDAVAWASSAGLGALLVLLGAAFARGRRRAVRE
ncbi:glycosyl hydrolase [Agromyces soli]